MKLNDIYKKIDSMNEQASMNISMSGETADDVGKLLRLMKDAGLEKAEPVSPDLLSPGDMRGDIDKFKDIVDKGNEPEGPPSPCGMDAPEPVGGPDGGPDGDIKGMDIIKLGGIGDGDKDSGDDGEATEDHGSDSFLTKIATSNDSHELIDQGMRGNHGPEIEQALQDMYNNVSAEHGLHPDDDHEAIYDRMADDIESGYGPKETDYANQPDEKYGDTKLMTKDLAGGLNGPKQSYPKVAGGDNPMSIRAELTRLENDIKGKLSAELKEKLSGDK